VTYGAAESAMPAAVGGLASKRGGRARSSAALLVLPLVLFVLVFFVFPILLMLSRSVYDPDIAAALPRTAQAIASWSREGLPDRAVREALVADLATSSPDAVGRAGRRLNSFQPGFNSLLAKTRQAVEDAGSEVGLAARLGEIDAKWNSPAYWATLANNAAAFTDSYLLAAVDMKRTTTGDIAAAAPSQRIYGSIFGRTLKISFVTTAVCLLLAFPLAYGISAAGPRLRLLLLGFVLLPFWTSLLVRSVAWVVLLQREGLVTATIRLVDPEFAGLALVHNRPGVYIAMVHTLLPFAVLPLYAVMVNIPKNLVRASFSLGAPPLRTFLRVYLPQTAPGLFASGLLVFISAIGYYITPALVGGGQDQLVSYYIATFVNATVNWGMAAALSVVLIAAIVLLLLAFGPVIRKSRHAIA
jgi:putative spermidine/putrescine transport system permease protein